MNLRTMISSQQILLTSAAFIILVSGAQAATGAGAWTLNKVAQGTPQAYCTISQNFVGQGVVTLGQTPKGEYSIAFDLSEKIFTSGRPQNISLKTNKISAQTFSITPQSANLAVLNFGANNALWTSFHAGDELILSAGGKDLKFSPSQTGRAQKNMMDCVAELKAPPKPVQAASAPQAQPQAPAAQISNQELSIREENARLKQALQQREQQLQATQTSAGGSARITELADKVRLLELENAQLKATGSAIKSGSSPELARAKAELETLAAQKAELQKQLQIVPTPAAVPQAEIQKITQENAELKARLDTLTKQITANDKTGALKKADEERESLKQQLALANNKLTELQNRSAALAAQQTGQNNQELQKRMAALETENKNLKIELASKGQTPVVTVNPSMRAEIEFLRSQVARLQADNAQLSKDVVTRQANVSTTPQAQNFDLAQATKRYEEAQREIRRLGAIIQAQESKHVAEKREIEGMLFDPAIASSAQVALKQSYEQRINDLENQMRAKGITPTPSVDPQAIARALEPASGNTRNDMPSGYSAVRSHNATNPNSPPPAPSFIPPITEAEISRDMMPLPLPQASMIQQPNIQPVPVERVIERVVERTDPKKEAELAKISEELKTLRQNQEKQALENASLRTALIQNQKAKEDAEAMALVASQQAVAQAQKPQPTQITATVKPVVSDPLPVASKPAPVALPNFVAARDVDGLLRAANISLSSPVSDMGGASDTYRAFRWKSGELFGSIEQRVTGSAADYRVAIASYMDRARARCKGDFAAEASTLSARAANAEGYEIACIGGKVDTSASVLFSFSDRIMTTIAHEGKTDIMGEAMNARDKLAQEWVGTVTASR